MNRRATLAVLVIALVTSDAQNQQGFQEKVKKKSPLNPYPKDDQKISDDIYSSVEEYFNDQRNSNEGSVFDIKDILTSQKTIKNHTNFNDDNNDNIPQKVLGNQDIKSNPDQITSSKESIFNGFLELNNGSQLSKANVDTQPLWDINFIHNGAPTVDGPPPTQDKPKYYFETPHRDWHLQPPYSGAPPSHYVPPGSPSPSYGSSPSPSLEDRASSGSPPLHYGSSPISEPSLHTNGGHPSTRMDDRWYGPPPGVATPYERQPPPHHKPKNQGLPSSDNTWPTSSTDNGWNRPPQNSPPPYCGLPQPHHGPPPIYHWATPPHHGPPTPHYGPPPPLPHYRPPPSGYEWPPDHGWHRKPPRPPPPDHGFSSSEPGYEWNQPHHEPPPYWPPPPGPPPHGPPPRGPPPHEPPPPGPPPHGLPPHGPPPPGPPPPGPPPPGPPPPGPPPQGPPPYGPPPRGPPPLKPPQPGPPPHGPPPHGPLPPGPPPPGLPPPGPPPRGPPPHEPPPPGPSPSWLPAPPPVETFPSDSSLSQQNTTGYQPLHNFSTSEEKLTPSYHEFTPSQDETYHEPPQNSSSSVNRRPTDGGSRDKSKINPEKSDIDSNISQIFGNPKEENDKINVQAAMPLSDDSVNENETQNSKQNKPYYYDFQAQPVRPEE